MDEELNSSVLGSYEFWDNFYNDEIENFKDHGDVGEIWFGKKTAKELIKWIDDSPLIQKDDFILDLGCGNGMLLIDLWEKGFSNLHGVDYSKNAIELATAVSEKKNCSINFFVGNILEDNIFSTTYHLLLDKGTYDAISLDPEDSKTKRQIYIKNVKRLLRENGIFIITSCNWTETELINQFNELEHFQTLPAPVFTYGGKVGKTLTTVIFKKR